jgi:cell division protein FtsB
MSAVAEAAPRARTGGRTRFTPRAAILAVVLLGLLFYVLMPFRTYMAQRSQLARLERQSAALQQQNANLQRRIRRLNDPNYLERVARECLGMVRPGEIAFVVVPGNGSAFAPDC